MIFFLVLIFEKCNKNNSNPPFASNTHLGENEASKVEDDLTLTWQLCIHNILSLVLNLISNCVTQFKLYTLYKLSSPIFCCLSVCEASVTPDQISTFSNIYRHTSPLLTMYHLISSSTNLYWPSTSQYRHILTQYHQVPLIIHHLMSHAQYTWSSFALHFAM